MKKTRTFDGTAAEMGYQGWPCFEAVDIVEDGKALGILLREFDGTISAIRIPIEQLAD